MWVKKGNLLINLNHVYSIRKYPSEKSTKNKELYDVHIHREDGTISHCIAEAIKQEVVDALYYSLCNALESEKKVFDVDKFLAVVKETKGGGEKA